MSETVASAVEEKTEGGQSGRGKALIAAIVIGFAAGVLAYRLLREDDS
jgi:hypothetical protein